MDYGRVLEEILEDSGRFWAILARIATLEMAAFFCGCRFWVLSCFLLGPKGIKKLDQNQSRQAFATVRRT